MTAALDPALIPMGATKAWMETVQTAGLFCQCTGRCGRGHRKSNGRCDCELTEYSTVRLYAVPLKPGSPELIALCGECLDRCEALARKAAAEAAQARADQAPSLLDLLAEPEHA